MSHSAAAYSIYILPVLTFLAQLDSPPAEVYEAEKSAIAKLLPGPFDWCTVDDAFHLSTNFGQHRAFPSLRFITEAAQRRVIQYENREHGGLGVRAKAAELRKAIRESNFAERKAVWGLWFDDGPTMTLERNKTKLDEMGINSALIL